jgi:hypothetical protein
MDSAILGIIAFLFFFLKPALPLGGFFPGVQPLIDAGPVHIDWTDLIALALVGVLIYGMVTHHISPETAAKILAGALTGKALSRGRKKD